MTVSAEKREAVRQLYQGHCGYCGTSETAAGNKLTVDHFQPRSHAGSDELDNLVYCCVACNNYKHSYQPDTDDFPQLLHPLNDSPEEHIELLLTGYLNATTPRGRFQIQRLRLNRPQLVAARLERFRQQKIEAELERAKTHNRQLQKRVIELEQAMRQLRTHIEQRLNRPPDG